MLLDVRNLTMRFGGLTAVDGVTFSVDERRIDSVIGPNGAGKTTVFNAVTGIYEPTAGTITFQGRELRRPLTPVVIIGCAIIGLLTGLAAGLFFLDIDKLWHATIKVNYADDNVPFSWSSAWTSAKNYWHGDLRIEKSRRVWKLTNVDGSDTLGRFKSVEEAEAERDVLQSTRRRNTWLGLLFGTALGSAGSYAVWNRTRRTPDYVARSGIARTFQNIRLFKNMTVLENVLTAMDREFRSGPLRLIVRTPAMRLEERAAEQRAIELLKFISLDDKCDMLAKNLPYGDQRRLEIARAMATGPRLILLDEPAAGMNPSESVELTKLIERIRDRGIAVLLIEHHMKLVMEISDRITVLDYGRKIAEGTPTEVRANPAVIKAYLGDEEVT